MLTHNLVVFSDKFALGAVRFDGQTALDRDGKAAPKAGWVLPGTNALNKRYTSDAHCALYAPGNGATRYYRLNKEAGQTASDVYLRWCLVDVDRDGHSPWPSSDDAEHAVDAALAMFGPDASGELASWPRPYVWATRNGMRLCWPVAGQVHPPDAEPMLQALTADLERLWALPGLKVDTTCAQWNRLFRLPWVRRDDEDETWPARLDHGAEEIDLSAWARSGWDVAERTIQTRDFDIHAFMAHVAPHSVPRPHNGTGGSGFIWYGVCPWYPTEHNGTDSYVKAYDGGGYQFRCEHARCQGRTWHDFRAYHEPDHADRVARRDYVLAQRAGRQQDAEQGGRTHIEYDPAHDDDAVRCVWDALGLVDSWYLRDDEVVKIRKTGAAHMIAPVSSSELKAAVVERCSFTGVKEVKGEIKVIPLSSIRIAGSMSPALEGWQGKPLRPISGIADAPCMLPGGRILRTQGYDAESGLYLSETMAVDTIHAPDALAILDDCVCDFPFDGDHDKRAWLAYLLTLVARRAINGPVPLFAFEAPTMGSGKTLLADVAQIIALGAPAPQTDWSENSEELRKRLHALALEGARVVVFDNVRRGCPIGGSALAAALTCAPASGIADRVLGTSEIKRAPWWAVVSVGGNGISYDEDIRTRRVIQCRLVPTCERPEERTGFRHDNLRQWALQHRQRLLSAALSLLTARATEQQGTAWGSYEAWCDVVRDTVMRWTGVDVVTGRARLMEQDDTRDAEAELFDWLYRQGAGMLPGDMLAAIKRDDDVRGVMSTLGVEVDAATQRSWSSWLAAHEDRIAGGMRLVRVPDKRRRKRAWAVTHA